MKGRVERFCTVKVIITSESTEEGHDLPSSLGNIERKSIPSLSQCHQSQRQPSTLLLLISDTNSMNTTVFNRDGLLGRTCSDFSSTQRDVRYSCGSCGYELNLSSSNRNTSSIGSKYEKSIKRGKISFFNIDASKFIQVDELRCMPHFSKHSWGLFRRRTKLLCRKCGNNIGNAYDGRTSSLPLVSHATESPAAIEESIHTKYDIRIRSLQPSSY